MQNNQGHECWCRGQDSGTGAKKREGGGVTLHGQNVEIPLLMISHTVRDHLSMMFIWCSYFEIRYNIHMRCVWYYGNWWNMNYMIWKWPIVKGSERQLWCHMLTTQMIHRTPWRWVATRSWVQPSKMTEKTRHWEIFDFSCALCCGVCNVPGATLERMK